MYDDYIKLREAMKEVEAQLERFRTLDADIKHVHELERTIGILRNRLEAHKKGMSQQEVAFRGGYGYGFGDGTKLRYEDGEEVYLFQPGPRWQEYLKLAKVDAAEVERVRARAKQNKMQVRELVDTILDEIRTVECCHSHPDAIEDAQESESGAWYRKGESYVCQRIRRVMEEYLKG